MQTNTQTPSNDTIIVSPMQWNEVPDGNEVPPINDADRACLREIRDVLARHGALDRFGINLIHKHFEIGADECLVETIDVENRTLTVAPRKKEALGRAIETQWSLASGNAYLVCEVQCVFDGGHNWRHNQRPDT